MSTHQEQQVQKQYNREQEKMINTIFSALEVDKDTTPTPEQRKHAEKFIIDRMEHYNDPTTSKDSQLSIAAQIFEDCLSENVVSSKKALPESTVKTTYLMDGNEASNHVIKKLASKEVRTNFENSVNDDYINNMDTHRKSYIENRINQASSEEKFKDFNHITQRVTTNSNEVQPRPSINPAASTKATEAARKIMGFLGNEPKKLSLATRVFHALKKPFTSHTNVPHR